MQKFTGERTYKFYLAIDSFKTAVRNQHFLMYFVLIGLGFLLTVMINKQVSVLALFDGDGIFTVKEIVAQKEDDTVPQPTETFVVHAESFVGSGTSEESSDDLISSGSASPQSNTNSPDNTASNSTSPQSIGSVTVEPSQDISGGYSVGGIDDGDWLAYTFTVPRTSTYDIALRVAREQWEDNEYAYFRVEVDGKNVSGRLALADTGGWYNWITMDAGNVTLNGGSHSLVIRMIDNDGRASLMNFHWYQFIPVGDELIPPEDVTATDPHLNTPDSSGSSGSSSNSGSSNSSSSGSSSTADSSGSDSPNSGGGQIPSTTPPSTSSAKSFYLEAEDYGRDGQNVSYYDRTPGNDGGAGERYDDVDIERTSDTGGGYNVGYIDDGEWLKYEINIATESDYTILTRVAREPHGGAPGDTNFRLYVDGRNVGGTITVTDTGDWQAWSTLDVGKVRLSSGKHVFEFRASNNNGGWGVMNVNWFKFVPEGHDLNIPPPSEPPEPDPTPPPTDPTPPPTDPTPPPTDPTPPPTSGSSDGRSFGSRPIHNGQLRIEGQNGTVIENLFFKDMQYAYDGTNNHVGIYIVNSTNITIRNVDFQNMSEPIAISGGSNIVVEHTRTRGITGPHQRHNVQTGNFLQTVNEPTNVTIRNNTIYGGDTEDIISLWSASYSTVENNYINGTGWSSASGTGIILGDGRGTGNVARGNTLYNPGQVGIAIAGGWNHLVENNIIYGPAGISGSNTAAFCNDYSNTSGMSGHEFRNNRAWYWSEIYGSVNGFWNPCGSANNNNNWNDPSVRDIVSTSP